MRASDLRRLGLTATLAMLSASAHAQTPDVETRLREALRTTTTQLREAQDEVAALQGKQADYEHQIQTLSAKLAAQPAPAPVSATPADSGETVRLRAELEQSTGKARQAEEQLSQSQTVLEKWQAAYKQAADVARARDADAKKFEALASQLTPRVGVCEEKNAALYKLGLEVLAKFEDKDVFDELKEDEPFTQIARVKLENLVQDYQDKFHDQKISPAPGAQQSAR
ncbi:MAG TPA: hypothetical protein VM689_05500 [Aliidongia sp.]|nr:hypothetical protein [Aliidongia sp.]